MISIPRTGFLITLSLFWGLALSAEADHRGLSFEAPVRHRGSCVERITPLRQGLQDLPQSHSREIAEDWKPLLERLAARQGASPELMESAMNEVRRNLLRRLVSGSRDTSEAGLKRRRATLEQLKELNLVHCQFEEEQPTLTLPLPGLIREARVEGDGDPVATVRAERLWWLQAEREYLHSLGPITPPQRREAVRAFREANAEPLEELRQAHFQAMRAASPSKATGGANRPSSPVEELLRQSNQDRVQLLRDLADAPESDRRHVLERFEADRREAIWQYLENRSSD